MNKNKLITFFVLTIFIIIFFISIHIWNDHPSLPKQSNPPIITLNNYNSKNDTQHLKITSYNIHFGIGFDIKTKKTEKFDYITRLNEIANILKKINADIVLLQEVDFDSKRSSFIDQSVYLANKAGYNFIAKSPTLRKKIHLSFNKLFGKIEMGLCVLSKYPIEYNESRVFKQTKEIPFFAKWLFDPHGAQQCIIKYHQAKLNIINVHLDPWSQQTREEQIKKIKHDWIEKTNRTTIVGGDFNALSPFAKKEGFYLLDAPWFIDRTKWNIKNDKTIPTILKAGFQDTDPNILKKIKNFTFPSDKPKEKIDFIFSNKAKIITGFVYKEAKKASDHLPIVAEFTIDNE